MNSKKQYIILLAFILLLSLFLGLKNCGNIKGRINYRLPVLEAIEENTITSIDIEQSGNSIKLFKDNGVWRLNPENLRADLSKITQITSFLAKPLFIDMVSSSTNYQNYGLGEVKAINVKAWIQKTADSNPDRELSIGNSGETGRFTYVLSPDDSKVYTVNGNVRKMFEANMDNPTMSFIDRKVLDFNSTVIDRLDITSGESNFSLIKITDDDGRDVWQTKDALVIADNDVGQSLRYLSGARFDSYADNSVEQNQNIPFRIVLHGKDGAFTIEVLDSMPDGYLCSSSYTGKRFILSKDTSEQIVKMFTDLISKHE